VVLDGARDVCDKICHPSCGRFPRTVKKIYIVR
jgi:hypothetical protein